MRAASGFGDRRTLLDAADRTPDQAIAHLREDGTNERSPSGNCGTSRRGWPLVHGVVDDATAARYTRALTAAGISAAPLVCSTNS
ncbi:hypothetical protein [Micromonospora sp. LOL_024]|uniref:hypothetical protein n=1 Tax=Micromonospora sp. LOL_024 TaxID=3345412 RepID=UPI003A837EAB